jgi:hypothetical protein
MITSLDKSENTVMVYPLGKDRGKARREGEVMRPLCQQSGTETTGCMKLGSPWHLDAKNQQSYGNGENAIAERLNSPGFFSIRHLRHFSPLSLDFHEGTFRRAADLARTNRFFSMVLTQDS